MRWSNHDLMWGRPLRSILAIFNNKLLKFDYHHLSSSDGMIIVDNFIDKIKKNLLKSLDDENIKYKSAEVYSTPTRLALLVRDLPTEIKIDAKEVKIGRASCRERV